jgi:hypothetical protein
MVLPSIVINKVKNILEENISLFPQGAMISEIGEDNTNDLQPPYLGIYADFDETSEITPNGYPTNFPVSIFIMCHSSEYSTDFESFNEAFIMARNILKLTIGDFSLINIDNKEEFVQLKAQSNPMLILKKSAKGSIINVQLTYSIFDLVG